MNRGMYFMKSTAKWVKDFQFKVDNNRGHEIILDLPHEQGGQNLGATPLELTVMGLSGCISAIFVMVAQKSRLEFEDLSVDINAIKGKETIESAEVLVRVKTENLAKANKVLEQAMKICPVGILFEKAHVTVSHKLIIE